MAAGQIDKFPFRFKQFSVYQGLCAMKVNTDGVLLGAWAEVSGAKNIIDIGTGTGVIAMMMAQKNQTAHIDAIDIDEEAFTQAGKNFKDTPWAERLSPHHVSLQNFSPEKKYDVVISNPPYFFKDFQSVYAQRNIAKHSTELSYEDLASGIARLMSDEGRAFLVLPIFNFAAFEEIALRAKLFVTQKAEVTAIKGKQPYVVLLQLEKVQRETILSKIDIHEADGSFTQQYKAITKDFYLKF